MVCHNCGRVLLDRVSLPHSVVDLLVSLC
jgi:hypothetical protein